MPRKLVLGLFFFLFAVTAANADSVTAPLSMNLFGLDNYPGPFGTITLTLNPDLSINVQIAAALGFQLTSFGGVGCTVATVGFNYVGNGEGNNLSFSNLPPGFFGIQNAVGGVCGIQNYTWYVSGPLGAATTMFPSISFTVNQPGGFESVYDIVQRIEPGGIGVTVAPLGGAGLTTPYGVAGAIPIPEPGTLTLVFTGSLFLIRFRSARRRAA